MKILTRTSKIFTVLLLTFSILANTGCSDEDMRDRLNDVVGASSAVTSAIVTSLPPDSPKLATWKAWHQALDRFNIAFNDPNVSAETRIQLWADVVSGFSAAVTPLVQMGSTITILIIALDVSLRFFTNRFNKKYAKEIVKLSKRVSIEQRLKFETAIAKIDAFMKSPEIARRDCAISNIGFENFVIVSDTAELSMPTNGSWDNFGK